LAKTANWMLKRLYKPGYVYQKSGVILNDLVPAEGVDGGQNPNITDAESKQISLR
jgi:hypothetical protein